MARSRESASESGFARLGSLDALRGVLLLLIVGNGFGLGQLFGPQQLTWITAQFKHREWTGCSLWDLLPAGMLFCAGLAMPFSYANRLAQGWPRQFLHALFRAAVLLLLGFYLDSYKASHLTLDFRGCLQQIALAYLLAFLVLPLGMPVQGVTVGFLLIGHTAAHVVYALVGGHDLWSQQNNLGMILDRWLGLPPHHAHEVAFNLVSNTAILLVGVMTGGLVRTGLNPGHKVVIMTAVSFLAIMLGWLLSGGNGWIAFSWYAVIPLIPHLGTLTFVLTALGWMLLGFTYFFILMEGFLWRSWAVPITLVGRNSLILYAAYQLFRDWAVRTAGLALPDAPPLLVRLRPLLLELLVLLIFWLFCFALYRRRIFIKV